MTDPAKQPATYEDLFNLPEHLVAEIVDGELIVSPRPDPRHANAASALAGKLVPPFGQGSGGPGGWRVIFEPELHLGGDILVPDLAAWRRERMPELPRGAYFDVVPDWICEITSPSTARLDRLRKMPRYAGYGANFIWMIDPAGRALEVFELINGRWTFAGIYGDDERVRAVPFDVIEIALGDLWT